jgi:hypothetical protein
MNRKFWIIVFAGAAILLLNNLHIFGRNNFGTLFDLSLTIFIVYRAVKAFKRAGRVVGLTPAEIWGPKNRAISPSREIPAFSPAVKPTVAGLSPIWVLALIAGLLMICFSYHLIAMVGLNFFVWGDHILGESRGERPVIMWAIAGVFLGAVVGSLVIWRKYHIKFQWCLATIIPFTFILVMLQSLSDPLQSVEPRPLVVVADSNHTELVAATPVRVKKRRRHTAKAVQQVVVPKHQAAAVNDCVKEQAMVIIHARSDSVHIYYRTADYQHGPWSEWKSKFVPQQGQFSLTADDEVRVNSLQYYYEIRSVLTRSAQNPYTRLLCEGQLVIDTY